MPPRKLKASQFNIFASYDRTGEFLLYNTLTGAFIAVGPIAFAKISSIFESPKDAWRIDSELTSYLQQGRFLVDIRCDERAIVVERNAMGIQDENRLDAIIMPNMDCNLACTYCYEEHDKGYMDDETARRIKCWLRNYVPRFKAVLLSWFGGEPTLSFERILELQKFVLSLTSAHSISLSSHMTTNGLLLTPERVKKLIALQVHSFQITIDGPSTSHDKHRPRRGGGGSFQRIFKNVCALACNDANLSIRLRVNYNAETLPFVSELLDSFPANVRENLDLVLEPIFGGSYGLLPETSSASVGQNAEKIYEKARILGFRTSMATLEQDKLTFCYADRKNQFLINYNGDVFKCTVDKFQSKDRLGYLAQDGSINWDENGGRLSHWHGVPSFEKKCYSCEFMPMCMGGCRALKRKVGTVGDSCKAPFRGFDDRLRIRYAREGGDTVKEIPEFSSSVGSADSLIDLVTEASSWNSQRE
jgi:uncharacterized protein